MLETYLVLMILYLLTSHRLCVSGMDSSAIVFNKEAWIDILFYCWKLSLYWVGIYSANTYKTKQICINTYSSSSNNNINNNNDDCLSFCCVPNRMCTDCRRLLRKCCSACSDKCIMCVERVECVAVCGVERRMPADGLSCM